MTPPVPPIPERSALNRLRMRHFELLAALGAHASVHAASRALNMTQPAATKLLQEIEDAMGSHLFDRTRAGVTPTSLGAMAVERARLMLNLLDGTRDALAAVAQGQTGIVNVGVYAVAAPVLLPGAMALLRAGGSRLRVRLEEGSTTTLLMALREGRLDCVVGRLPEAATDDLACQPLYDEAIVLVARPGHPLARKRRLAWADALGHEWILPPPGAPLRALLRTHFAKLGLPEPVCMLESVSILANLSVTAQGDTLVMLPAGVALHYERLGQVRRLALKLESALPPVSVILRKGESRSAAITAFLHALTRVGRRG